jgi:cyanophycinase-like exopeptidase
MSAARIPAPIYLLAGDPGARRGMKDPLICRAIASCGFVEPSIAYIGAASGDDKSFFTMLARLMVACGAGAVELAPLAGRRVKLDRTRSILEKADMVFVSGGDVEEGMNVIGERGMLPLLRDLYRGGKPFFGLSAGSIMLARQWIVWEDPSDDSTASAIPCLGFAPVLCDTHAEEDDWEELRALLLISPEGTVGYGIPTGGGLLVRPGGEIEALGKPASCLAKLDRMVKRRPDLRPDDS